MTEGIRRKAGQPSITFLWTFARPKGLQVDYKLGEFILQIFIDLTFVLFPIVKDLTSNDTLSLE